MKTICYIILFAIFMLPSFSSADEKFEKDVITTSIGKLTMTFIGHGTLMFELEGTVVHIDPVSEYADYSKLPKADLILVTHEHGDHLDMEAVNAILKSDTEIILTKTCYDRVQRGMVMKNGDVKTLKTVKGIKIEAIPAYNLVHMRNGNNPFHPKGIGNGYVLTFGDVRVYVAGDTENTPEMKTLKKIDVAFLPMNLPYTMDPEMVADAAKAFKPRILYPYHFGNTDTQELVKLLEKEKTIEVRIRRLQ